ncbi:winged helix-turn-helix transcriptional regulator [Kutzneria sp. CA-103260]|uniref:winged helix-turn-helix transcriptional regulator n=1 Tax=Kutzneria sp. CA-103260 TaxID=2802641 RepID=UPI001BED48AC|nr:helix-turn-helix domain-containing protein [Kutzneria sp. CA-103260]QUQ65313.1 HxlR family transcriptional regulator [Kutzneria sp. CA-103260]
MTVPTDVPPARTYGDGCAIAHALDLIGERWALLVIRELLLGPKRYSDVQAGVPNARPNVLSQRLRDLERSGLVQRRKLGPPARAWVYELTERGRELEPVLLTLGDWGRRSPLKPADAPIGTDSLLLALKTHFAPARWRGAPAAYRVELGDDVFAVHADDGGLTITRGEPAAADVTIRADIATFRAVFVMGRPVAGLDAENNFEFAGDLDAFRRLVTATT